MPTAITLSHLYYPLGDRLSLHNGQFIQLSHRQQKEPGIRQTKTSLPFLLFSALQLFPHLVPSGSAVYYQSHRVAKGQCFSRVSVLFCPSLVLDHL